MDMKETLRHRFWVLKDELDVLEPEVMAMRDKFNAAKAKHDAKYEAEIRPLSEAFKAMEAETDFWKKKQELADITKFLRDERGIAKMGPRPVKH